MNRQPADLASQVERIAASDRWIPSSLDLKIALEFLPPDPDEEE